MIRMVRIPNIQHIRKVWGMREVLLCAIHARKQRRQRHLDSRHKKVVARHRERTRARAHTANREPRTASHAHLNHVITRVIARQTRPTHRRQRCARQHTHTPSVKRHAPIFGCASRVVVVDHRTHRRRWHPRTRPHRRARLSPRARASSRRPRAPYRAAPTSDAARALELPSPPATLVHDWSNAPMRISLKLSRSVSARRGVRRRPLGAQHAFHAFHNPAVATERRETRR